MTFPKTLNIRYSNTPGLTLGISIEQISTGLFYDFATAGATAGQFTATPTTLIEPLPADVAQFTGRYKLTMSTTPAFTDGDYVVTIHNLGDFNTVVTELSTTIKDGSDQFLAAFPTTATITIPSLPNPISITGTLS